MLAVAGAKRPFRACREMSHESTEYFPDLAARSGSPWRGCLQQSTDETAVERLAVRGYACAFWWHAVAVGRDAVAIERDAVAVERDAVAVGRDAVAVERDAVAVRGFAGAGRAAASGRLTRTGERLSKRRR
jgi:hypothetical protein